MKKFLVFLCAMFVCNTYATTVNIDWLMDGATYAQTTCETGGNFTLPTPTPTKYGYHFVGWQQNDVIGSWSQSGTPTPDNPIEPTFRQFGNTVLRAVGSGNNLIADSYDTSTGKITRRVGVKVLDGTEDWTMYNDGAYFNMSPYVADYTTVAYCSHYTYAGYGTSIVNMNNNEFAFGATNHNVSFKSSQTAGGDATAWERYLADQYNAGTPVTIYYPLATPVEENYNAQ